MGFFSNEEFIRYKKCTQPVYQTPASIQQMLDIAGVHENGIFEIEPNNGAGKKRRKFDRVYSFSDLNYVDQDKQQKDGILFQLRKFLNSMDTDFKITIQCEPRDVTNFQKSLLQDENKSEYPELARYNNEMIKKSLEKGQENVRKQRYLTVSANCRSIEEAEGWFDTFEHTALPIFYAMGSELVPLNAVQRFQKIRNYFFTDDGEESFILPFQDMVQAGRDFRNSILPHSVRNHKSYMEFDEECMRILFAAVLPTRLNEEKLIFELTDFPFYTCLTIDTAYIPREVLRGKISNTNFYNVNAIGQEVQANASMGNFYSEPSYATKMERKKTQATTAKLKKVQTEIKKTKDKLNKLMAEEERLTVQYQTESYEETLAYLKSASKNGKPDLEEMWKFLQSTYSPELKNSVSPSTGNSAPSEESTDDVEENSETEETSSTVPEQKISHYDSNDLEFLAD